MDNTKYRMEDYYDDDQRPGDYGDFDDPEDCQEDDDHDYEDPDDDHEERGSAEAVLAELMNANHL